MEFDFEGELSELSSIGDSFTNLIYSIAVSQALKKPVGRKASNHVLSQALLLSGLRDKAGSRLDKGEMADFVEALIFYAWIKHRITLEECVAILRKAL
ncbi:MAG: ribonuclease III family protein, partial [Candidatus Hydrothermarchaeales archaeon]